MLKNKKKKNVEMRLWHNNTCVCVEKKVVQEFRKIEKYSLSVMGSQNCKVSRYLSKKRNWCQDNGVRVKPNFWSL